MPGIAEITVEEAKKDLQSMVAKEKSFKEKEKEAVMSEEEKIALEDTRKKEQEAITAKEAEDKKNADILAKKDEELSEEEKKTKTVLVDKTRADEESKLTAEEKIKRIKEETQKRIDEIHNELKQVKDKGTKDGEALQAELRTLRQENENLNKRLLKPDTTSDTTVMLKKKDAERIANYLEVDAQKPREERREMTKEELSEWTMEDLESATEWIAKRTMRRERERYVDVSKLRQDEATKNFTERQSESNIRVTIKHSDLDTSRREAELKAQGKSGQEIHNTLVQENEKYRLCTEIVKADPDKYMTADNGPELVMQEMERRLVNKPVDNQSAADKKVEELTKRLEDAEALIASLQDSDIGINSTVNRKKGGDTKLTDREKVLVDTLKSLKTPQANIDSALKKLREKEGK
jgi:hypothetical protein